MMRLQTIATFAAALLLAFPAVAQNTTGTDQTNSTTAVRAVGGTPGSWVRGALSRHAAVNGGRVNWARTGEAPTLPEGASGSSTSSSGLSSLLSSLGAGGLGDLTSLLNLVTGGSTSTSGTSGTTGTTGTTGTSGTSGSGGVTIPPPSNGTDYTLADLLALQAAHNASQGNTSKAVQAAQSTGTSLSDLTSLLSSLGLTSGTGSSTSGSSTTGTSTSGSSSSGTNTSASSSTPLFGGAIARLPKAETRFQTTTDDRSFGTRFLDATLQTVFTALAAGMQSTDFVNFLKDQLRPLVLPPAADSSNTDGNSNGGSNSGGNNNSGGSGGGIEDLPPSGNGSGNNGGSTI